MTIISRIIIICKFRLIQIFMYHVLSSKNIPNKPASIASEYGDIFWKKSSASRQTTNL